MPVGSVSIEHSLLYIDSSFRKEVRSTRSTLAMILLHRGTENQYPQHRRSKSIDLKYWYLISDLYLTNDAD